MAWHVSRGTHDLTTEQQGDEPGSSDTHRHVIVFSDNSTEELHATIKSYLARSPQSPLQVLETWYRSYKDAPSNINLDNETIQVIQTDSLNDSAIESCIQELSQNITITNRFCATCHSYFGNWPSVRKTAPSYFSCHTLIIEAAARKGCHFCSLALTFLKDVDNLNLLRKIEVRMLNLGVDDTCTLSILRTHPEGQQSLWIDPPGKPCDDRYAGIAMKGVFETDAIDYEVHVPEGTEKEDMLQIAKEWLNTCDTRHEECCMANDYSLPTRLIKVSGDEPQLVLTATLRAKVQYSTLSHRWGDIEFFKLTDENLSRLLTVIPLAELPKTFQDAIHITKQLGLEYLWIDSLCILQGNADDWRFEAGRMSSVYGGSYVNIAASDATNANEGCFLKAPYSRSALRAVVKVGDKAVTREFRRTDLYLRSVLQPHLATRAWVCHSLLVQEQNFADLDDSSRLYRKKCYLYALSTSACVAPTGNAGQR